MNKITQESLAAGVRNRLMSDERIAKMLGSSEFKSILSTITAPPRPGWIGKHLNIELWLAQSVKAALAEPEVFERMTGAERKAAAKRIVKAVGDLSSALAPFVDEDGWFTFPFQPHLDFYALEIASVDEERWRDQYGEDESAEISHRTRYAVYHAMNPQLGTFLGAFVAGAEHLADVDTILKKPNSPNARRLYFLRRMTQSFTQVFGRERPHREATLRLACMFFDCEDLDEAAVSTLAPVRRPEPIDIPIEELHKIRALMVKNQVDTSTVDKLIDREGVKLSGD